MKQLICTSYNKLPDGSLQLRNNWVEEYSKDKLLSWGIDPFILFNTKGESFEYDNIGVSNIQEGMMRDIENVAIHIRILNTSLTLA